MATKKTAPKKVTKTQLRIDLNSKGLRLPHGYEIVKKKRKS